MKKPLLIIFLVLLIDQVSKFWVKTTMYLQEDFTVGVDWFHIHFTENPGMAFGMEFAGEYGKLALSIFRILAVMGIGYYLVMLVRKKVPFGLQASIALILAGALGNILDSAFYGLIFNDSSGQIATFMPDGGGYAPFLHGRVVDMLYFPVVEGYFPDWFPFWAGDYFIFFRPVFNIADSAITIGVIMIILFQKRYFAQSATPVKVQEPEADEPEPEAASS